MEDKEYKTENFKETNWKQSSEIFVTGKRIGVLEVCYLEEKPEIDEGPFHKEERELINAVTERLGRIIERIQSEEALRESDQKLSTLLNATTDVVGLVEADGTFIAVNDALAKSLGRKKEELIGKNIAEFLVAETAERRMPILQKIVETKKLLRWEDEHAGRFFANSVYPIFDDNGNVKQLAIFSRNITAHKKAEETLKEKQQMNNLLLNSMPYPIMLINKARIVMAANKIALDIGVKIGDYCWKNFGKCEHLSDKDQIRAEGNLDAPGIQCTFCRADGMFKANAPVNDPEVNAFGKVWDTYWIQLNDNEYLHYSIDITENRQAEEALRESEEKFRTLFDTSPHAIALTEMKTGKLIDVNDNLCKVLKYTKDELIGRTTTQLGFYSEDDRNRFVNELTNSGKVHNLEMDFKTKDGSIINTRMFATFVQFEGESFILVEFHDVTEKKRVEEALRETEEKYRLLIENATDSIVVAQDGVLKFSNSKAEKITGYSAEELGKIPFVNIIHPEDRAMVFETRLKRREGENLPRIVPFRIVNKSGEEFSVESNAALIDWEGRSAGLVFLRDTTAQNKLEARLQQANRMEAIATLAGGVAHEFNNSLVGIMGHVDLLGMNFLEDEGRNKSLHAMNTAGHRMSRLTDQLLAYAEGGKYQPKNLKLDDFVIETLPILEHDLNPTVRVETHFQKDISFISADNAQMQMVLSAILSNSNEAIEDEGLIRITAENKDVDDDLANQHVGLKLGPYVCITVEDDGNGMDEETKKGIFKPFFTTKFQGRGMGMAAVHGIVRNHNGWISVESELGKGTKVQIYLPIIEVEAEKQKAAKAEITTGSGTILMIEDEDVVIEVTQAILEMLGYRVMVAKTGKDAIHIAETYDGQIDLALLDIKLPDINGRNLYPLIMKARSNLKVIVWSGYSIDGPAREILDEGAQGFIQKPFSVSDLSEKLKEVLEGE